MGIPECYVNERLVWTYKISRSNDSRRGKLSQPWWRQRGMATHSLRKSDTSSGSGVVSCCVVRHIGSEHWTCATTVSDNKQLRLLISCDMIVIRSAVVFGLFFSGEQKSNNIVVCYSRYVVVDNSYKNKTNSIIVLLWPYNRMVRWTDRLFIIFPCVVNMEF